MHISDLRYKIANLFRSKEDRRFLEIILDRGPFVPMPKHEISWYELPDGYKDED